MDTPSPLISVVVCTRNRAASLRAALDHLSRVQSPGGGWELIVVDNGSTDETGTILSEFGDAWGGDLSVVCEPRPGLGRARKVGVAAARGEIVAFTDDDCYVAPDYLLRIRDAFVDPLLGFIGGRVWLFDPTDARVTIKERIEPDRIPPHTFLPAGHVHGANMAIRRRVIHEVGDFDPMLGAGTPFPCEDVDLLARVLSAGWTGAYCPEVAVWHHHGRKPGPAIMRLNAAYDYGIGAYFAKFILRRDTRKLYLKAAYWSLRKAILRREYGRFIREIRGMLHYLSLIRLAARNRCAPSRLDAASLAPPMTPNAQAFNQ
jgi:glycosyltransferase involved in cell wall biosynthesis